METRGRMIENDLQFGVKDRQAGNGKVRARKAFESSKERKRRVWRERQSLRTERAPTVLCTDWMFLPDLVLEHIFTFLSYKV